MAFAPRTRALPTNVIDIDGRHVPVKIRHHPRARRYVLKIDLTRGEVCITAPKRGSHKHAVAFAQSHSKWIGERLAEIPSTVGFCEGAEIPFQGRAHIIRHVDQKRGVIHLGAPTDEGGLPEILVPGDPNFLARRMADWLRAQAKQELSLRVAHHASALDVRPARITIRDQSSRWGSCSQSRTLSFSWRLILTPPDVLDYVAAHEVAHLMHMDHSKSFWKCLAGLYPNYRPAVKWLEEQGPSLHRYG
ncbi:MAG: M48 family metallopeptidase [Rhodobiaceae bacterium]|nr:M48 family metallopeptidase [Rhodobiaceae bacterium]